MAYNGGMKKTEREARGERIRQVRESVGLNQTDFGTQLGGIKTSTISGYESGYAEPKPNTLAAIAAIGNVSLDWLITGTERGGAAGQQPRHKGEIAASIEPGRRDVREKLSQQGRVPTNVDVLVEHRYKPRMSLDESDAAASGESFSMSEMVSMTVEVLESKTVYRSALASNVRAFHQAVKMEGEMQGVKDDLRKMQADMDELKVMIRSLGGIVPEKRDAANHS